MKRVLKYILIGFVGLIVLGMLLGDGEEQQQAVSNTETASVEKSRSEPEPELKQKYINQGMYKIGTDLAAGEYVLFATSGMGYFAITSDSSGTLESIIANDNFFTTSIVQVKDGQYLELQGAKALPINEAEAAKPVDGKLGEGMYKVGRDLPAGEYKIVAETDLAYFERSKDASHTLDAIITNDNFQGEKYVTVSEGEYIKLTGCYLIIN